MASDYFIKIDGIDGQSDDKAHGKWIEVVSFTHGSVQNVSVARGADSSCRSRSRTSSTRRRRNCSSSA